MAGYIGYSMSCNAGKAYNDGLKPKSKWTKKALVEALNDEYEEYNIDFSKYTKQKLNKLLSYSGWHHTSQYYNCTDFYGISAGMSKEYMLDVLNAHEDREMREKNEVIEKKVRVIYLDWYGSRRHPKCREVIEVGILKGNWIHLPNGSKKNITTKGVKYTILDV